MTSDSTIWLLIGVAFLAANLPFLNERLMAVVRLSSSDKGLGVRLAEMVVLYFVVGAIGLGLEHHAGQIYPQGWEFYAVTASMFLTFAFPGFVYRYLGRRR